MKRGRHAPASLIDITGIVPEQIELQDGAISIGAGATHAEVAGSSALREHFPALAALVNHIGDPVGKRSRKFFKETDVIQSLSQPNFLESRTTRANPMIHGRNGKY